MGRRDAAVIKVNTETELAGFAGAAVTWRRPDSDASTDRYREWEVPGASHDDAQTALDPSNEYLFGLEAFPTECEHSVPPNVSPTDFRYEFVEDAASKALVDWVAKGKSPAHAPPIKQTNLLSPSEESILRDQFGNALGGVRTPQLEVPISKYNVIDTGLGFCSTFGWSESLSSSTLNSLYPTHGDYVRAFTKSAKETVRAGFWLEEDAARAIREAKEADIP